MFDGFPVPDLDFDDIESAAPLYDMVPVGNHTITDVDQASLEEWRPNWSLSREPLRCTNNSSVYLIEDEYGNPYALKVTLNKERIQEEYNKCGSIPKSIYIVEIMGIHETPRTGMLLMELCENGDIAHLDFSMETDLRKLIHDIACALTELHSRNLMHLDVSPGNILLGHDIFKLADFGTVMRVGDFVEGCEGAGPYVSPEALAYPTGYAVTTATDIFSFGVVLLEAATGRLAPRGGCSGYSKLREGTLKLGKGSYISNASNPIQELINSMLDPNPNFRPTAGQILSVLGSF